MIVVGIDPSLSNFGLAKGTYHNGKFFLSQLKLINTEPDNKNKKVVRKNSDDLERAKKLYTQTKEFIDEADLLIAEVPVGSQSARAMASYGACVGILACLDKPLIQVTPNEVKLASVGSKTASKQQMIEWATTTYPSANWLTQKRLGKVELVAKNEHLADAVAAVIAGLQSDTFKQLLSFKAIYENPFRNP